METIPFNNYYIRHTDSIFLLCLAFMSILFCTAGSYHYYKYPACIIALKPRKKRLPPIVHCNTHRISQAAISQASWIKQPLIENFYGTSDQSIKE